MSEQEKRELRQTEMPRGWVNLATIKDGCCRCSALLGLLLSTKIPKTEP